MMAQTMVMVFRRRSSKVPVNSIKHIIDAEGAWTESLSQTPIATAVSVADAVFKPVEVTFGRTINAFFLSIFAIGLTGAPVNATINWYLMKKHQGQTSSIPPAGATGNNNLRNQIIHEEKGLSGSGDGTPMVFKGVVVVPRGMRRMREGDEWFIGAQTSVAANDVFFCIKAIYKSFG